MATAQEAPKVTSAIIALRGNELVEAKGFIDEATTIIDGKNQADIKEKIMSKFYYNKALIYSKIAASPDAGTKALAADANVVAAQLKAPSGHTIWLSHSMCANIYAVSA